MELRNLRTLLYVVLSISSSCLESFSGTKQEGTENTRDKMELFRLKLVIIEPLPQKSSWDEKFKLEDRKYFSAAKFEIHH